MLYQRKLVPSLTNIGEPGPLPADLEGLTDETLADLSRSLGQAAVELGYANQGFFPDTEAERWISKSLYLQRFTATERKAIRAARASDEDLDDLLYVLENSDRVYLDAEPIIDGFAYLVAQNLLTAERAAEIRA